MEKIEQGHYYHIFNKGNNSQTVFFEDDNYVYFLMLLKRYLLDVSDVYCYCLLPNHFHILIRIKDEADDPSQKLSNLFNAYTKAINKRFDRSGSLFQKPFKRIKVTNETYLKTLVLYIHLNPIKHQISDNFSEYEYSSYQAIVSKLNTKIVKDDVIDWFDSMDHFIEVHKDQKNKLFAINEQLWLE